MSQTEMKKIVKLLREKGWEVITDPEEIVFDDIWNMSAMLHKGEDPRRKGARKPILLRKGNHKIMVEPDPEGGWWAWDHTGRIITSHDRKVIALFAAYLDTFEGDE
ncbi:MAG: hypothetical protein H0Z33_16720 [Bacillaceae bacterium]|nr:hypothetical protein [Bacillaceae bacterium]